MISTNFIFGIILELLSQTISRAGQAQRGRPDRSDLGVGTLQDRGAVFGLHGVGFYADDGVCVVYVANFRRHGKLSHYGNTDNGGLTIPVTR